MAERDLNCTEARKVSQVVTDVNNSVTTSDAQYSVRLKSIAQIYNPLFFRMKRLSVTPLPDTEGPNRRPLLLR